MEKKRKKVPESEPQIKALLKPIQKPGILMDKDRQILDDVQNIIWDPDRLNKFKNDGNPGTKGFSKKKVAK